MGKGSKYIYMCIYVYIHFFSFFMTEEGVVLYIPTSSQSLGI